MPYPLSRMLHSFVGMPYPFSAMVGSFVTTPESPGARLALGDGEDDLATSTGSAEASDVVAEARDPPGRGRMLRR
jgi:hypothetical protein